LFRVGPLLFESWRSFHLGNGWSDTFIFPLRADAGLPPADYAAVVRRIASPLARLRRGASLWVPVEGKGTWFYREVAAELRGLPVPTAVTDGYTTPPRLTEFSYLPSIYHLPTPAPPLAEPFLVAKCATITDIDVTPQRRVTDNGLACLRILARLESAFTAEIASLAGLSLPTARQSLSALKKERLCFVIDDDSQNGCHNPRDGRRERDHFGRQERDHFPVWCITRRGTSLALRSWCVPLRFSFQKRSERSYAQGRHKRTARLWPAWLRRSWPDADIWTGWSEVSLGQRLRPDALAWGRLEGRETLFWLEVERGSDSRAELQRKTVQRFNQAMVYARQFSVHLVFALLAPPWVRETTVQVFRNVPEMAAVVLADWKGFGVLPVPAWGEARW
jgi:hypothetical protein